MSGCKCRSYILYLGNPTPDGRNAKGQSPEGGRKASTSPPGRATSDESKTKKKAPPPVAPKPTKSPPPRQTDIKVRLGNF